MCVGGRLASEHLILKGWFEESAKTLKNFTDTAIFYLRDLIPPTASRPANKAEFLHYHEHSKGPPVGTLGVPSPVHHLWGHVLYRPAERVCPLVMVDGLLTQTKIYKN